ncbi:MAG TPA: SHOCT domain-containing protein [Nitrososphaeraceae archaeon]|jgi:hypothetical protein
MRGRWASAAIGAGIASHRAQGRAEAEIQSQQQANQIEMEKMKASYQHEIDQMKGSQAQAQAAPQPQQSAEDPMAKLKKLADLKQQGILSEEEFQKMKAALISQL